MRQEGKATAALLQRRWRLGYTKAVAVLGELERRGIVGAPNQLSQREVITTGSGVGA